VSDEIAPPFEKDAHGLIKRARELTGDEVGRYLGAVGSDKPCPFCGSGTWLVASPNQFGLVALQTIRKPDESHDAAGYFYFIVLHCGQCAYTRMLNATQVVSWIENQHGREIPSTQPAEEDANSTS
jgi:ribosomal protein S27AE